MLHRIGVYDPATQEADDLTRLKNVGPLLQQHLHQVGIYRFDQVSKLKEQDFELLDEVIENFPIQENRAGWIEQANKLKNK